MAMINFGSVGNPDLFDHSMIPRTIGFIQNFKLGSHNFNLALGSVVDVNGRTQTIIGTKDYTGFLAYSASVWTIRIDGLIRAYVVGQDEDDPAAGIGMFLANGGSTGLGNGISRVTVGSEGGVYGRFAGIQTNNAINVTNNGAITGDFYGIFGLATNAFDAQDNSIAGNLELARAGGMRTISVNNTSDGIISGGNAAIYNDTLSALSVTNAGQITGGQRAVDFRNDGAFTSTTSFAVGSYGRLTLTNNASGTIDGGVMGAWLGSTITNAGTINGTVESLFLPQFLQEGRVDANRDGDFADAGDFLVGDARLVGMTLTNSGVLNGYDGFFIETDPDATGDDPDPLFTKTAFDGSLLRDVITNTAAGEIFGNVYMYGGNDSFTNAGLLVGVISTDNGNDVVTNAATGVILQEDDDSSTLHMGAGNDSFTNAGTVEGFVVLAEGSDTLSNSGALENVNFDRMFEDDRTTVRMTAGDDGNDLGTFTATSTVNGALYLGFGNNTFNNAGRIEGDSITFTEAGRSIDALIVGRAGNDSLTNSGRILGAVDLGAGADRIVNSGRIQDALSRWGDAEENPNNLSLIHLGAGDDTLTNTGEIGTNAPIFLDNRWVSNDLLREFLAVDDPVLGAAVDMSDGNDSFSNISGRASGKVYGVISMGAGDDTVTGGAFNEIVVEGDGRDSYALGAGADAMILRGLPDAFADTLDGGAGVDVLGFFPDPALIGPMGHRIDLAAGRLVYMVQNGDDTIGNSEIGVDRISGFEQVLGSAQSDFIFGGAGAETLNGAGGDDVIVGGAGRDVLTGGAGADRFVFNLASQSGATRAARDVITDFEQGVDKIVLAFDSNTASGTANAGLQSDFTFGTVNRVFEGLAGEIRHYHLGQSTIVEVDTNGDRRADFSLALQWTGLSPLNLTPDDFIFGPLP